MTAHGDDARRAASVAANGRPVTEVAVGILVRADGCFLLGQRPPGKPYAGYWEFPGGKIEAGETIHAALVRELHEELGINVLASAPWRVLEHDYPHAYVRLHLLKVTGWHGEPTGREGQALCWQRSPVDVAPLLPAAVPMIEWLAAEDAPAS
jgi:8-oxo-dGTP diphosphatase